MSEELLNRICDASELNPRSVLPVLRICRWNAQRLADTYEQHGSKWFEVMTDDAIDTAAVASVSRIGPQPWRNLSGSEIGEKHAHHPALNRFAENYRGGNALIIGRTRVGKSITAFRALRFARYRKTTRELKADPEWLPKAAEYIRTWWKPGMVDRDPHFLDGWTDAIDLNRARSEWPLGKGECPAIESAKNAGLIVLDEIGLPARDDLVLEILWHRYNAGKYTIVTCGGLERDALEKRFGDAAIARMLESNGHKGQVVDCFQ